MNEKYHMILTVRLPVEVASWLQMQANDRGVSVQEVIRGKLDEAKRREASAHDDLPKVQDQKAR